MGLQLPGYFSIGDEADMEILRLVGENSDVVWAVEADISQQYSLSPSLFKLKFRWKQLGEMRGKTDELYLSCVVCGRGVESEECVGERASD